MYGDTDAARRRVRQLRERALDIRTLADSLVAQSEAVPWRGRAAEAMRGRIRERATHLRSAAEQHDVAADALARHVGTVDELKEAIGGAEHRAAVLTAEGRPAGFTPPPPGHADWLDVEVPAPGEES
jgi:hypothetical protein